MLICRGQFFHFYFFYLGIYWFWHTILLWCTFFLKCLLLICTFSLKMSKSMRVWRTDWRTNIKLSLPHSPMWVVHFVLQPDKGWEPVYATKLHNTVTSSFEINGHEASVWYQYDALHIVWTNWPINPIWYHTRFTHHISVSVWQIMMLL